MPQLLLLVIAIATAACREVPPPHGVIDANIDTTPDVAIDPIDGPPVRHPCTDHFGSVLTEQFGRLDGILVAVGCSPDSDHLHLQVEAGGAVYDVAVNTAADVSTTTRSLALADPWLDGWHTDVSLGYVDLGVHAGDFTSEPLVDTITAELATVNHISIYATGYGPTGAHLVHRNHGFDDGAIVIHPLSDPAQLRMFRFAEQVF